jgi:hypothetical protein
MDNKERRKGLESRSVLELKKLCADLGIKSYGKKDQIIARILEKEDEDKQREEEAVEGLVGEKKREESRGERDGADLQGTGEWKGGTAQESAVTEEEAGEKGERPAVHGGRRRRRKERAPHREGNRRAYRGEPQGERYYDREYQPRYWPEDCGYGSQGYPHRYGRYPYRGEYRGGHGEDRRRDDMYRCDQYRNDGYRTDLPRGKGNFRLEDDRNRREKKERSGSGKGTDKGEENE